ncbi:MAG: winged helix-turn-helix domain-containing protein [Actinobacteria bacterium]|nr:winged helix-turn-helix domain-containing protein [Actinomycetota bacterium]
MSSITAVPRPHVRARPTNRPAAAWSSRGVAGSLALLDPDLTEESALLHEVRRRGVEVQLYRDDMSALIHLGRDRPDVVLVSASTLADLGRLVTVLRREVGVPVLLAFADDDVARIGAAVTAGASPAVGRPYMVEEILTALRPYWSRSTRSTPPTRAGGLTLEPDRCEARFAGSALDFSLVEFRLVASLAERVDHVVDRRALARAFWPDAADPDGALVATIARVRRKLVAAGAGDAIRTVRGMGYRLESGRLQVSAA